MDQHEIAELLGCTRQNVGLILQSAMRKMRGYCKQRGLKLEDILIIRNEHVDDCEILNIREFE